MDDILAELGIPDSDGTISNLIKHPPKSDVVIRTIYKSLDDYFMIEASLVVCSGEVRRRNPAAQKRPVQFLKTARVSVREGASQGEYERAKMLFEKFPDIIPEPILGAENEFRSEYIPGVTLRCLALRFGLSKPMTGDMPFKPRVPSEDDLGSLFRHANQVAESLKRLHEFGYIHGDLHLENVLIAPGRAVLVDLETVRESRGKEDEENDFKNLRAFARRLLDAGAKPPKDSFLFKMLVTEEAAPLPSPHQAASEHHKQQVLAER